MKNRHIDLILIFIPFLFSCSEPVVTQKVNTKKINTQNLPETIKNRMRDSISLLISNLHLSGQKIDETSYHKAIYEIDTTNIKYLANYSGQLFMTGNSQKAFYLTYNALRWAEKRSKIYACLGSLWELEASSRMQKKIESKSAMDSSVYYREKACMSDSNDVELFVNLCITHIQLNRNQEGIKDIEHAIRLQPDNRTHYLFRGMCKYEIADYKGAYEDLRIISGLRRSGSEWYYYRALAASHINKILESKLDFDTCEMLNYKKPDLYYFRGIIKTNLGDFEGGYSEIKKSFDMGYPVPEKLIKKINEELAKKSL